MFLVLLLACPVDVVVDDPEETAAPPDDTAEDSAAPPSTDFGEYTGWRRFVADQGWYQCDETETDAGEELTSGEVYSYVHGLCPSCEHVYQNDPTPSTLCNGYLMIGTAWRAVDVRDDGTAAVYFVLGYDTYYYISTADEAATWDGETLSFGYTLDLAGAVYQTTGQMTFPLQED